ncbi:NAD(P)-binding protein [Cryphonectria parasitica EP155]|uniref:NAD(P)-binding protein n=1 Tax=Cryphonectria parasitica (strain ATCC 38755 / EP155) TaxID=660469 RepID=A0A9P5CRK3_CRYP1|nr:NAD(P)-binding protein [Cryphonectria parasitica EP155]KAF3768664.1 NAD(P)-binding protein [Cryphonectria parasitica EP155]
MDAAAGDSTPSPFIWLWTLIAALDFHFLATFFYNQFRPVPYPKHDFSGKTILVTGANAGLGFEAARHFARLNAAKVILGCRDAEKAQHAKAEIERSTGRPHGVVEAWPLDLTSFDSVREFCSRAGKLDRLDAVVENASVAMVSAEGTLAEGFECTITVNVISTFLMALLLLPTLRRTSAKFNTLARLTIVSSEGHIMARFTEKSAKNIFDAFKSTKVPPDRYQTSKLLQQFIVQELAEDMSSPISNTKGSVILNTVNPGFCRTLLFRHNTFPASVALTAISYLIGRSAEAGSRVLVDAAAARPETNGKWLDTCELREPSAYVRSEEGEEMQIRVYEELMRILEEIEPGITRNI